MLQFGLAWGSSYNTGTDNTWATSGYSTSNQVNWMDSTSNNFYITGVQLEEGSNATPFEHRTYGDELLRCKRYYQRKQGGISNGQANPSGVVYGVISYEEMRAAPTITSWGTLYWNDGSAQSSQGYNVAYWISTIGCSVGYTGTASANRPMTVYSAVSGNNGLALDAEL